jgi:chromosome segregation ATPase
MSTISTQTDHCVDVIDRLSEDFDQENEELRKTLEHHWRCREIADAKVIELNEVFKHAEEAADVVGCEICELSQTMEEHQSMIDDSGQRIDDLEDNLNQVESYNASLFHENDDFKKEIEGLKTKIGEVLHRESSCLLQLKEAFFDGDDENEKLKKENEKLKEDNKLWENKFLRSAAYTDAQDAKFIEEFIEELDFPKKKSRKSRITVEEIDC